MAPVATGSGADVVTAIEANEAEPIGISSNALKKFFQ
jgi:hypothetical protein